MKLYKYLLAGSTRHRWMTQPPEPLEDQGIFETTIAGVYALGDPQPIAMVEDEAIAETNIPGVYAIDGLDIDTAINNERLQEQFLF